MTKKITVSADTLKELINAVKSVAKKEEVVELTIGTELREDSIFSILCLYTEEKELLEKMFKTKAPKEVLEGSVEVSNDNPYVKSYVKAEDFVTVATAIVALDADVAVSFDKNNICFVVKNKAKINVATVSVAENYNAIKQELTFDKEKKLLMVSFKTDELIETLKRALVSTNFSRRTSAITGVYEGNSKFQLYAVNSFSASYNTVSGYVKTSEKFEALEKPYFFGLNADNVRAISALAAGTSEVYIAFNDKQCLVGPKGTAVAYTFSLLKEFIPADACQQSFQKGISDVVPETELVADLKDIKDAINLIKSVSSDSQEKLKFKVSSKAVQMVTKGAQTVFPISDFKGDNLQKTFGLNAFLNVLSVVAAGNVKVSCLENAIVFKKGDLTSSEESYIALFKVV